MPPIDATTVLAFLLLAFLLLAALAVVGGALAVEYFAGDVRLDAEAAAERERAERPTCALWASPTLEVGSLGERFWKSNGALHRLDGPAAMALSATEWWQGGVCHREDGPARQRHLDCHAEWHLRGEMVAAQGADEARLAAARAAAAERLVASGDLSAMFPCADQIAHFNRPLFASQEHERWDAEAAPFFRLVADLYFGRAALADAPPLPRPPREFAAALARLRRHEGR